MENKWKIDLNILEQGDIYFFYKPRRGVEKTAGIGDVSRFYLVLQPADGLPPRYIVMGGKKMPRLDDQGETSWGFIQIVGGRGFKVTKANPTLRKATSRPAGEGIYAIVLHRGHSHLLYSLELPRTLGAVQNAFNIKKEANYIFLERPIERPPVSPDVPYSHYHSIETLKHLNKRGTEILLVGVGADINRLGIKAEAEKESVQTSDIINRLQVSSDRHPLTGIISGNWV